MKRRRRRVSTRDPRSSTIRRPFAGIDVHNNTGRNPHYACVTHWEAAPIRLAGIFGRTVVHAPQPTGTLCHSLSDFVPTVTIECGRPGEVQGTEHAAEFLHACLHLAELPTHVLNPRRHRRVQNTCPSAGRLRTAQFALDTDAEPTGPKSLSSPIWTNGTSPHCPRERSSPASGWGGRCYRGVRRGNTDCRCRNRPGMRFDSKRMRPLDADAAKEDHRAGLPGIPDATHLVAHLRNRQKLSVINKVN